MNAQENQRRRFRTGEKVTVQNISKTSDRKFTLIT